MTSLSIYNGNFVEYVDDFKISRNTFTKAFQGIEGIELSLSCDIVILPSQDGLTTVEIDTEFPNDFKVFEREGIVIVESKENSGGTVVVNNFGGGRSVTITGGNISMANGQIYVNGNMIDKNKVNKQKPKSRVRILTNHGLDLASSMSGISVLASKVVFNRASLDICGQSTVGLAARNIDIKLSGQGDNYLVCKGGELDAKVSGQGSILVKGSYSEVEAKVSGMGQIRTNGICSGSYRANLSGMGSINHNGLVKGRIHKKVSGMGTITGL